jgi:hypothetical protein
VFEHSIVAGRESENVLSGSGCTFTNTILSAQTTPPPGTTIADPKFVDPAAGDYHLQPSSPAIDAAADAQSSLTPDLDGTPRPQGSAADLGAYERRP